MSPKAYNGLMLGDLVIGTGLMIWGPIELQPVVIFGQLAIWAVVSAIYLLK